MYRIQATYAPPAPGQAARFDRDYYLAHHAPLARRLLEGRLRIERIEVEFDVRVLMNGNELRSPCVFALYVPELADVEAFRDFRAGPDVTPLKDDVEKYTDLPHEWTVAEVHEQ
jgi:hypothetical protein